MKLNLAPAKYVVAVSGGLDSMVLLDLVSRQPHLEVVVAHFDHGTRTDSYLDSELVEATAKRLNLPFEQAKAALGEAASEAEARRARYDFLRAAMHKYEASAILTAHHQDDLIETAIINLLRGTGPAGLTAIANNPFVKRPLLGYSKAELKAYAADNNLTWRDDPTNQQEKYLRNYIRKNLLPRMSEGDRQTILNNVAKIQQLENETNALLAGLLKNLLSANTINRAGFSGLPYEVGNKLLVDVLRRQRVNDVDKVLVNRLNVVIRTGRPGSLHKIRRGLDLKLTKDQAEFVKITIKRG